MQNTHSYNTLEQSMIANAQIHWPESEFKEYFVLFILNRHVNRI